MRIHSTHLPRPDYRPTPATLSPTTESPTTADTVSLSQSDCKQELDQLKEAYKTQILVTGAWMGGTLASLAVGLVAPVVSVPLVATTAAMTVRSIGKAVNLNKQLADKTQECQDRPYLGTR